MKRKRRLALLGMAGLMAACPATAMAASPEFARTAEEWARLQDNVLEYDEIEGLIAEYNATVQANQLELNEFKRKYGNTKDDISAKYRDMADEIYASISYPDADDPTYGYVVASVLMAEVQAKNLEQQADENLDDSEIIYLNNKLAEKTLATVAQSNMISYAKGRLELEQAEISLRQAETSLASAQARQATGTATQVDVLNAQEALLTALRNLDSAKSGVENVRQKLLVMLGWKFNDNPEIREIPSADMERAAAMDPEADKETALKNNYTLQVNKKKLSNAASANVVESLQKTIADNERKIGSALVTSYQNVITAKLAYDQAKADLELADRNFRSMEVNYQLGNVSRTEWENQQYAVQSKRLALKVADMNLFQAMETYDWAVNGLASTS